MISKNDIVERFESQVEVDAEKVAGPLLDAIAENTALDLCPDDAIRAGVASAIDAVADDEYADAVEYIEERVSAQVEAEAKQIAMRLIKEMAANVKRDSVLAS